jgi:hypothetical protein
LIKQVPVENLKLRFLNIKIVTCVLLFLTMADVRAQSTDDASTQSEAQSSELSTDKVEPGPEVEISAPDVTAEKNEEDVTEETERYNIYRKDDVKNPCDRGLDSYDYEKQWYDSSQIYINSKFCEPVLWFDNFFGNDRLFEEGVAGTYIRWRNDFTHDEEANFNYKMGLNVSVELPGFDDKLRLTFEGNQDEDLRDIAPGTPGGTSQTNIVGLQVDVAENERSKFSANVSLSPRLLLRYRYTYPINKNVTMRFTQEFERKKAINKGRTRVDYEHTLKENLLFRSSSEGKVAENFEGVDWLQAFVLYQRLNKRASLAYETSANGITQPRSLTTNYRVGVRYRKNFHREWLFYEIAPEVAWPITLADNKSEIEITRRSKYLIFFRLEVHFGNARKKRYQSYY